MQSGTPFSSLWGVLVPCVVCRPFLLRIFRAYAITYLSLFIYFLAKIRLRLVWNVNHVYADVLCSCDQVLAFPNIFLAVWYASVLYCIVC